jgi:putative DNA primase/helicase
MHTMESSKAKFSDLIRVVSTIRDIDDDQYFIEIEFRDVEGNAKRTVMPRNLIRLGSKALDELLQRGANLPGRHGAGAELRDVLNAAPGVVKRVTSQIGWHGESFVLFDRTIGLDSETLRYRGNDGAQEEAVQGSLDDWRAQLRTPCRASSYLTFGIAAGFAGPFLELLGQDEGGTFYLFGESSTGKTLSTLTGQSVIGSASRTGLITHDITPRALEETAAAHNDLMLVLEEIDRSAGGEAERRKHVRQVGHTLAAGVGRRRSAKATQDSSLANLYWRFFSLWTGEYPLDAEFLGEARRRGEIVRLIEVPVPSIKNGGIFDRIETTELSSAELAKAVEDAVRNNYGHPIRKFLELLVSDREVYADRAATLVEKFVRKVGAESDPWTRRFATKFAVVYAAARIAAEMKIAPWPKGHAFKCVARLHRRARNAVATPEEALADLLHRLAANATSETRFPVLKKGKALPKGARKKAWGIRRDAPETPSNLAVHSKKLDELVRPRRHAGQVRRLLAEGDYTLPGKEGRFVSQLKVRGFGSSAKPYFVRIRADRLPQ